MQRRVDKLHVKLDQKVGDDDAMIAIDSTGIKVADRGGWMRQKRNMRRGFLKIHAAADVKTKRFFR